MAPQVCCGDPPSKASNVWSLSCTIYRLRSGDDLFLDFDTRCPEEALQKIERFLGDLPDKLAHTLFDDMGYWAKNEDGMAHHLPILPTERQLKNVFPESRILP